ncbi:pseudouridine synthase [Corallococcus sicarius]|uniref:Pseudouridine synthase n=1 Tax=Corallococcus sicarius TaxID=2316726 RepID=A0A3A8MLH6_9BACT|nr:pseudouridine synthase [Corallococcus sicarius]RKH32873.1 pseudouridine synthase [Corallococcus sicarius]
MAAERLQKYLARAGVASRRHAEELITSGRVGVNNQTVTELGSRVELGTDLVTVDGKLVTPPEESSYYLLYKPIGVVTTLSDPQGRPTVANYVEETGRRLFPVGRLDYDAEGALLFTDDGALAHKLTHPSFQVPRTYLAKVKGVPDMPTIEKLRGGVRLEDGMATPVYVGIFEKVERNTWLKIVVAEGRPHLIKRLCAAVGHPVVRLFRPAYAGVGVEGLRPGQLRQLKLSEVMQLNEVAEGRAQPAEAEMKLPPRRHGRAAPGFDGPDDDETELSMDDDAPMPPRKSAGKAERPDKRAAAGKAPTGPKTREARPERKDWKGVQDGGTRPPKFAVRGATLPTEDEDLDDAEVPTFDDDGEEVAEPKSEGRRGAGRAAEGETGGARGAGRAGRSDERAPRGAGGFGKPAGERAPRAGGFGKPAGERAPRAGGFGKPAGGSRFGSDEGRAPRAGGFGKPAGRGGDEGRPPRAGGFGKPAGAGRFGGDEGRPPRAGGFGKPAGAGRFGGDERGAPRGRPAGASRFGGDEGGAPRGRPTGGSRFGGDEGGAPRGRPTGGSRFGGDEGAPRGRPAGGSRFGGDEGRAPRAGGFGKPAGRGGDEGRPPRAGGFGKPAGGSRFGSDEGRPPRAGGFGKPAGAGRFGRDEGRPPRAGGFGKPAGGSRFGSDEGRPPRAGGFGKPAGRFSRDEGRAPRAGGFGKPAGGGRFGKPAGDRAPRAGGFGKPAGRFGRDEGRPPRAGGFGKPAGGSRFGGEGGARGGARFGKPAGGASRGEGRPERREWKPRGESAGGAGRPERREWKPRGEDGGSRGPPRERRGGVGRTPSTSRPGDSARPTGERIVRAGIRKGPPGEGGSKPPRGASDRSAPRGPRRPR